MHVDPGLDVALRCPMLVCLLVLAGQMIVDGTLGGNISKLMDSDHAMVMHNRPSLHVRAKVTHDHVSYSYCIMRQVMAVNDALRCCQPVVCPSAQARSNCSLMDIQPDWNPVIGIPCTKRQLYDSHTVHKATAVR